MDMMVVEGIKTTIPLHQKIMADKISPRRVLHEVHGGI
jgi:hypothetical protein